MSLSSTHALITHPQTSQLIQAAISLKQNIKKKTKQNEQTKNPHTISSDYFLVIAKSRAAKILMWFSLPALLLRVCVSAVSLSVS